MTIPSPTACRFWWVNQNQTFKQEIEGGYMWSPKRKANGHRNPFYEFMREVAPGDIIFSFNKTLIQTVGVATDFCFESPKPSEFGSAGMNWDMVGWKVLVHWTHLKNPIRPAEHMYSLAPLLPAKYAPLRKNGGGLQAVYLAAVPRLMAYELARLIGSPVYELARGQMIEDIGIPAPGGADVETGEWEDRIERKVKQDSSLSDTERITVIQARRGQGQFRNNVLRIEKRCRVTGVDRAEHLVASHCKPWRDCSDPLERLDGENGLMLTPKIDHLFDRGFVSFEGGGRLIISPSASRQSLEEMGVNTSEQINVGSFSDGQKQYLDFHRDCVFLASANQ